jgi:hypothetical protein
MSRGAAGHPTLGLTLAGVCVGIISIAFAVHPLRASTEVFWGLIALAAFGLVGVLRLLRWPRFKGSRRKLARDECRRLADAIDGLWSEQQGKKPRLSPLIGNGTARRARWADETRRRYGELQPWALGVFDSAVDCGALSSSSRPLVENPPPAHLYKLRDLFREAADSLERMSR